MKSDECCVICGYGFSPILHRHHIRPRSEGGTNKPDNLVLLCPNCHSLIHEYYRLAYGKDLADLDREHANLEILLNWIRGNLGSISLGKLVDIAQSRHTKRDKRYE